MYPRVRAARSETRSLRPRPHSYVAAWLAIEVFGGVRRSFADSAQELASARALPKLAC